MRVVIAGAGIGGLATALSLHDAGISDVTILESVAELRPLGVGINLLPHAVRELTELGLGDNLAALGVPTSTLSYYNCFGHPIWSEPRGRAAGYAWPQYSVHRGELQMLLRDAVNERLPGAIVLGSAVVNTTAIGEKQSVTIRARNGEERTEVADVLIAADGIHSAVRKQRYPAEGDPVWNGLMLWRGTARVAPFLDGRSMFMAGDGRQKFVAYPLSEAASDGLARINFIAEKRLDDHDPGLNDWNMAVDKQRIVELFQEWKFDWIDIPALIDSADEVLEYPMVDRDPVDRWNFDRQTLLGDAAHPMYPIGSNGASQAIIDARTVAHHLATAASIDAALHAYEHDRLPATAKITLSNRSLGPERVMQLAYERAPQGFTDIHDVVSDEELTAIADEYKRAAGFNPQLLNERPSLSVTRS
ncbi:flavin-dependent oxidoreductase [Salinibacterium sp. NG253]|uniref:flavin-dependent oxidoreductase n=1 Tax=Salinibacterium sp. NG253 TaxID=2792039 RepID=UPI0018CFA05B|nr:flavin-dependent oxidoreductase [Salinibacterium sp. NG253]MBH0116693.1 flavin-dependent oxidoreductase [Salinibacterium sp. NG253]